MPALTRRFLALLLATAALPTLFLIASFHHDASPALHSLHGEGVRAQPQAGDAPKPPAAPPAATKKEGDGRMGVEGAEGGAVPEELLHGHVIAGKLGNATAK